MPTSLKRTCPFGSTTTYTGTDLNVTESSITTWIFSPKAGVRFSSAGPLRHVSIWGGAMAQKVEEHQVGSIDVPGLGTVHFDANLAQSHTWNGLAGASFDIHDHFAVEAEGGFGNRKHFLGSFTYRF